MLQQNCFDPSIIVQGFSTVSGEFCPWNYLSWPMEYQRNKIAWYSCNTKINILNSALIKSVTIKLYIHMISANWQHQSKYNSSKILYALNMSVINATKYSQDIFLSQNIWHHSKLSSLVLPLCIGSVAFSMSVKFNIVPIGAIWVHSS